MTELPTQYLTKKQAVEKYPFLTANIIKNILHKNVDGFREKVVRRLGHRVLLDERALLTYIADCRESPYAK